MATEVPAFSGLGSIQQFINEINPEKPQFQKNLISVVQIANQLFGTAFLYTLKGSIQVLVTNLTDENNQPIETMSYEIAKKNQNTFNKLKRLILERLLLTPIFERLGCPLKNPELTKELFFKNREKSWLLYKKLKGLNYLETGVFFNFNIDQKNFEKTQISLKKTFYSKLIAVIEEFQKNPQPISSELQANCNAFIELIVDLNKKLDEIPPNTPKGPQTLYALYKEYKNEIINGSDSPIKNIYENAQTLFFIFSVIDNIKDKMPLENMSMEEFIKAFALSCCGIIKEKIVERKQSETTPANDKEIENLENDINFFEEKIRKFPVDNIDAFKLFNYLLDAAYEKIIRDKVRSFIHRFFSDKDK